MTYGTVKLLSKVSNKHTNYVRLDELPSNYRSYPENTKFFTRRLNMEESLDLSSADVETESGLRTLAQIYEDVIISDNPEVTLYDMELVDFQLALAVSSIWSTTDFKWNLSHNCPICDKHIFRTITLDDFNFSDTVIKVPVPVTLDDIDFNMKPLTIGDIIQTRELKQADPNLKIGMLEYASMLTTEDKSLKDIKDRYNFLKFISDIDYMKLRKIDTDITILNYPFVVQCTNCQTNVKFNKQFTTLKAFL